ncbi:hypothetical protein PENSPDRAFT_570814 [Peniophora sp. CONT]|nr:hypothetical protein PENSPDRAFT_570814 [Peniophora sp. CONT]
MFAAYEVSQDRVLLDEAIDAMRTVVNLDLSLQPARLKWLWKLVIMMGIRFQCLGDVTDLEESISYERLAVKQTPDGNPDKPVLLNNLGELFRSRFDHLGDIGDIEAAISYGHLAVDMTPDDCPNKPIFLNNLGSFLQYRFDELGKLDDLESAILIHYRAIELVPDDHPHRALSLIKLGGSLYSRFDRLGQVSDLEDAISYERLGVNLMPDNHPDKPTLLSDLGDSLRTRFKRLGQVSDLEEAIVHGHLAVDLTPEGHPERPTRLTNLGCSLQARFERLDDLDDLQSAIILERLAVELTPDDSPNKPIFLNNLGGSLFDRFERLNSLEDLQDAISVERTAVDLTSDDDPDKPIWLNSLGGSLQRRFDHLGDLGDLDAAVSAQRKAVELTPDEHPDKPMWLSNFGGSLQRRLDRLGDPVDLDDAIDANRLAVELALDDHAEKPLWLNNLGGSLQRRFERLGELDDIDDAISAQYRALDLTSDGQPNKAIWFHNLGTSLQSRFQCTEDLDDLEGAISAKELAVELTPEGHADKPMRLSDLGGSLRASFERYGKFNDLDKAITVQKLAVELTPNAHPDTPIRLYNLAVTLRARFEHNQTRSHFEEVVNKFMAATVQSLGTPSVRLYSAVESVRLLNQHPGYSSANSILLAHSRILDVLPEIVWLGHSISRRYEETAQIGELVNAAVAAAIRLNEPSRAVEWLEAGRSLVWSQVLSLRVPMDGLKEHHPELASMLQAISHELQQSASLASFPKGKPAEGCHGSGTAANEVAQHHRELVRHYENVLASIRSRPGFDDFLRPAKLARLMPALENADGPVVFINVHSSSCDALALFPDSSITHIALPELNQSRAHSLRTVWMRHLELCNNRARAAMSPDMVSPRGSTSIFGRALGRLWAWVMHPILQSLDLINESNLDRLSHITWCPTGPLTQLPLHAAGIYGASQEHQPHLFDYVVSSYTPSLSALLHCRQSLHARHSKPSVLVIAQPETPGLPRLPGTRDECTRLRTVLPTSTCTFLDHKQGTVDASLVAMRQHPWVHLACHGSQNVADPTQSAFALYDGPLTLSALMGTTADDAELAFLSACQTAVGDEKIPEESVHLAAGMLAVGFKGVVATMWSIGDADAPIVVEAYYKALNNIRETNNVSSGGTGAAYALHEAVKTLRGKVGESSFTKWAPFVHFGV